MSTRRLLAVILAVAVLTSGGTAWASHQFSDVPDSNQFHNQIAAIRGAGITAGFPDGGYHPSDPVSRGAMAAFMARGFGRVGFDEGSVTAATNNVVVTVAQTSVTPGATGAGTGGFVHVTAAATASSADYTNCPCIVFLSLRDSTTNTSLGTVTDVLSNDDIGLVSTVAPMATTAVFSLPAGVAHTYQMRASFFDSDVEDVTFEGTLTATYVPFGPTGGNTL